jgi:hypothetical protein
MPGPKAMWGQPALLRCVNRIFDKVSLCGMGSDLWLLSLLGGLSSRAMRISYCGAQEYIVAGSSPLRNVSPGGRPRFSPPTFRRSVCSLCALHCSFPIGVPDCVQFLIRAKASAESSASHKARYASHRCGSVCPKCIYASCGLITQLSTPKALAA